MKVYETENGEKPAFYPNWDKRLVFKFYNVRTKILVLVLKHQLQDKK